MTAGKTGRDQVYRAHPDVFEAAATLATAEGASGSWQQPPLIPAPDRSGKRTDGRRTDDRPSERLRHAGLVGIAQAREALAEAARRAKARSESQAA